MSEVNRQELINFYLIENPHRQRSCIALAVLIAVQIFRIQLPKLKKYSS